jgi:hypothetical protein
MPQARRRARGPGPYGPDRKSGGGISTETLDTIEHGRRQPQVRTLDKLARALGVEAQDLFA